jgi:excinuclease ABC subunit A
VDYKGKSIADTLKMTVEEASIFFKNIPSIKRKLDILEKVGLGYMELGQSALTLSGGESQRVKLAKELSKVSTGHTLYVLDEPTTGLHYYDVDNLLKILRELVDKGNTVIVVEHNLDVIRNSDWIIDLGPEGGDTGGEIVAQGTVEDIMAEKSSYTGQFLKKHFEEIKKRA